MLELLRDFGLKAAGHLVPFAVGWFYKPGKIAADLKFRVRGEGDGVTLEDGELPKVRIWFLVSNLSPFTVDIDRMVVQLVYGGVVGEILDVRKRTLGPSKEGEWLVEGSLNENQVAYIRKQRGNRPETRLNVTAFVHSKLHNFEHAVSMGSSNVRLVNFPV
jgi:hypothetical protein